MNGGSFNGYQLSSSLPTSVALGFLVNESEFKDYIP